MSLVKNFFSQTRKKEYEAMMNRTPSVGSMKDNMFAAVMYLSCYGFSYYKAVPEPYHDGPGLRFFL